MQNGAKRTGVMLGQMKQQGNQEGKKVKHTVDHSMQSSPAALFFVMLMSNQES